MPASEKSVAAITFCHIQRGNAADSAGVGMVKIEHGVSASKSRAMVASAMLPAAVRPAVLRMSRDAEWRFASLRISAQTCSRCTTESWLAPWRWGSCSMACQLCVGRAITEFSTRQCVNDGIERVHQHKLRMAFMGQLLCVTQPVGGFSREVADVDNFSEGKASLRLASGLRMWLACSCSTVF